MRVDAVFSDIKAHPGDLTGLPNRFYLNREIDAYLEASITSGADSSGPCEAALLLIDLNRFKEVNDTLGHNMGDDLLIALSKRLRTCLPPEICLVRLGGDEFIVWCPALNNG